MPLKRVSCFLAGLMLLACVGPLCRAQKVMKRKRLGNNSEQIVAIHSGPLAGSIAIMDGTDVRLLRTNGEEDDQEHEGRSRARTLFNVLGLGVLEGPRGITYIETQQRFVFDDPFVMNTLFLTDNHGNSQGTIPITYPPGFAPDHVEGLAWLPPDSAKFPNDILQVAISFGATSTTSRLEVIEPSGQVVKEIFPQISSSDPDPFDFITGLAFQSPDRLLVGSGDGLLWQLDFSGNVLAGPVTFPGTQDLEGIAQLDEDRIAVASYDAGEIMFVDEHLNRRGEDLDYLLGFGLSIPRGVAWNSDTHQHLVSFPGAAAPSNAAQVISLTQSLGHEHRVVDLTNVLAVAAPTALSYLPDEHRIAVAESGCSPNCSILLYDNGGNLVDQVTEPFNLTAIAYIPTAKQFAARRAGAPRRLLFFSRTGTLVRQLNLTFLGTTNDAIQGVAFFNPSDPSGGEFLIAGGRAQHMLYVVDFNGNLRAQFDYRATLGVIAITDLGSITSGPLAGAFSLVVPDTSEIVVFRLPGGVEPDDDSDEP